jgi:nucleoside-diphosphate-sugar epimerase
VLVTGAAGYLGGFVVRRLAPQFPLRLMDVRPIPPALLLTASGEQRAASIEPLQADITDPDALRAACASMEAVVHLVALVRGRERAPSAAYFDVMVKGTHAVCEACVATGVRRLVNISSIAVRPWVAFPRVETRGCGPLEISNRAPIEELPPGDYRPGDLRYQLCKTLGEEIGRAYHEAHGLEVIHLRPGIIEGDGANPGPTPPSDSSPRWNAYVHPEDVAQAVEGALLTHVPYGVYNIVNGGPGSTHDITAARRDLGYAPVHNYEDR